MPGNLRDRRDSPSSERAPLSEKPPLQPSSGSSSAQRFRELEALKNEFPAVAGSIDVRKSDANREIQALCDADWRSRRAVLFLDPYGMQVEWRTIEAVARTKAIDMWLLFPLGIGVNRLVTRSGDIPTSWRKRLDILLGTTDWYEEFYRVESTPTLFGGDDAAAPKVGHIAARKGGHPGRSRS